MKILVTGITKQQCGGGTALGYEPVSDLYVKALRKAGAEVEHRQWQLGEDPTEYDALMIGQVPFFSIASNSLYHALDAIASAEEQGVPWLTYLDDWRFTQLFSNLATHLRHPHQLTKPFFKSRVSYDWACQPEVTERLMRVTQRLAESAWPITIVPAFTWGDHSIFSKRLTMSPEVICADVSPFATRYEIPYRDINFRKKAWVLGTVSNQLAWLESLELKWPLDHIGTKTSRAPVKMPEPELVARYGENWGVLSPPYKAILGSGWWRNRFVYAARAGAILYCDPGEAADLGDAYSLLSIHEIEQLTSQELNEISIEQSKAFFERQADASETAELLHDAVAKTIAEAG
jgi:hypothetical protein